MTADYDQVEHLTVKVSDMLSEGKRAVLIKNGISLNFSLIGCKGIPSTGKYTKAGDAGNLPSGEAYIAPVEFETNGEMMIDGSMVGIGKLDEPLIVRIEKGVLTHIRGADISKISKVLEVTQTPFCVN